MEIEHDHAKECRAQAAKYHFAVEIAFRAVRSRMHRRRLLQVGYRSPHAHRKALAHAEQGPSRAYHHAADRDRTDDVVPHRSRQIAFSSRCQRGLQCRPQEVDDQGHQQSPCDHASGEVQ